MPITDSLQRLNRMLLAAGYQVWTRIFDDDVIFILAKCGSKPSPNDSGYRFLESAIRAKGVRL